MLRRHVVRALAMLVLVSALALGSPGREAASANTLTPQAGTCPIYNPNVDCWGKIDGWCPNHCNTVCP